MDGLAGFFMVACAFTEGKKKFMILFSSEFLIIIRIIISVADSKATNVFALPDASNLLMLLQCVCMLLPGLINFGKFIYFWYKTGFWSLDTSGGEPHIFNVLLLQFTTYISLLAPCVYVLFIDRDPSIKALLLNLASCYSGFFNTLHYALEDKKDDIRKIFNWLKSFCKKAQVEDTINLENDHEERSSTKDQNENTSSENEESESRNEDSKTDQSVNLSNKSIQEMGIKIADIQKLFDRIKIIQDPTSSSSSIRATQKTPDEAKLSEVLKELELSCDNLKESVLAFSNSLDASEDPKPDEAIL